jgi:hypothetical protein
MYVEVTVWKSLLRTVPMDMYRGTASLVSRFQATHEMMKKSVDGYLDEHDA